MLDLDFPEELPDAMPTVRLYAAFCQLKSFARRLIMF